jgi:hypothetical protein
MTWYLALNNNKKPSKKNGKIYKYITYDGKPVKFVKGSNFDRLWGEYKVKLPFYVIRTYQHPLGSRKIIE